MFNKNKDTKKNLAIPIELLQYECDGCEFKFYINLEDNIGEWVTCPKCGLERAIRKRVFNATINKYKEYHDN